VHQGSQAKMRHTIKSCFLLACNTLRSVAVWLDNSRHD